MTPKPTLIPGYESYDFYGVHDPKPEAADVTSDEIGIKDKKSSRKRYWTVFLNPCGGLGLPKVHDPKSVLACMHGSTLKEASANTKFWLDGQGELLDGKHVSGAGLSWLRARLRAYEQLWEDAVGVYDPSLIPEPELTW